MGLESVSEFSEEHNQKDAWVQQKINLAIADEVMMGGCREP